MKLEKWALIAEVVGGAAIVATLAPWFSGKLPMISSIARLRRQKQIISREFSRK